MIFGFIKNLLIVIVLFGALYAVTQYSPIIKKQTDTHIAKVLGTKTESSSENTALPDDLKKDAEEQVETVKEKAMDISLNDALEHGKRLQKIPEDVQSFVGVVVDSFLKLTR